MLASELAGRLGGLLEGSDANLTGIAPLETATSNQLSFLTSAKYADRMDATSAGAVLVSTDHPAAAVTLIRVDAPYAALRRCLEWLYPDEDPAPGPGVDPTAVVDPSAQVAPGVSIGPLAVVESGTVIGEGTQIGAGCYIGRSVRLGADCRLHPGVVLYRRTVVGARVEILANAVVGSDGFGHSQEEGAWRKLPHVGNVVIEDDVLIGACTTIDRATFGETRISRGARLDNLVMVAHNCVIGPNSAVAAQAGFAGSTRVGGGVQIGGQAGFAGHLTVKDGAIVGAQAGVMGDVPEGTFVSGYPARPHGEATKQLAALARLPDLRRKVLDLEKRLAALEDEDRQ